jgi:basic membrane protein A and related proteins
VVVVVAAPAAAPATAGLRVAVVVGARDEEPGDMARAGLARAAKELHVRGRVFVSASPADTSRDLATAARLGYDLVVAVDPSMAPALAVAAEAFPLTHFAVVGARWRTLSGTPPNARGLVFERSESGYLAGAAAALASLTHRVSSVGGLAGTGDLAVLDGFRAGARQTVPGTRVITGRPGGSGGQAACRSAALVQIAAGSDGILADGSLCGTGVVQAASERGRWAVGVGADLSAGGRRVLTSAVEHVDVAVFATIADAAAGRFHGGGDTEFDVHNGGIAFAKVSSAAPPVLAARLASIAAAIAAGKLTPPHA